MSDSLSLCSIEAYETIAEWREWFIVCSQDWGMSAYCMDPCCIFVVGWDTKWVIPCAIMMLMSLIHKLFSLLLSSKYFKISHKIYSLTHVLCRSVV